MKQYIDLITKVMVTGVDVTDGFIGTDEDIRVVNGATFTCHLGDGFPLLTTQSYDFENMLENKLPEIINYIKNEIDDDRRTTISLLNGFINLTSFVVASDLINKIPEIIFEKALIAHIIAEIGGASVGKLNLQFNNLSITSDNFSLVGKIASREPKELPKLFVSVDKEAGITALKKENFTLVGYEPWPAIIEVNEG